jgi:hypothetical protein
VPPYSTLSRRHDGLSVALCAKAKKSDDEASESASDSEGASGEESPAPRHIVIDSSGLKLYCEGEWKQRQHGKSKRRT